MNLIIVDFPLDPPPRAKKQSHPDTSPNNAFIIHVQLVEYNNNYCKQNECLNKLELQRYMCRTRNAGTRLPSAASAPAFDDAVPPSSPHHTGFHVDAPDMKVCTIGVRVLGRGNNTRTSCIQLPYTYND